MTRVRIQKLPSPQKTLCKFGTLHERLLPKSMNLLSSRCKGQEGGLKASRQSLLPKIAFEGSYSHQTRFSIAQYVKTRSVSQSRSQPAMQRWRRRRRLALSESKMSQLKKCSLARKVSSKVFTQSTSHVTRTRSPAYESFT
jgi:hypothetical protein